MRTDKTTKNATTSDEPKIRRKPGRKPMTDEEKEAAAKARAAKKEKADKLTPELIVQYKDSEVDVASLVQAVKSDFHQNKKRTLVTELKLYIKPEERAAYYVINGVHTGSVFF